jgi:hypothetical protein
MQIEGGAPVVECIQCLNRIIWPTAYRPNCWNPDSFKCPNCEAGYQTIVEEETTAKQLAAENGSEWLLRNDDMKIAQPFSGRSLFYTISTAGTASFADKAEILPECETPVSFTIRGKPVHNSAEILDSSIRFEGGCYHAEWKGACVASVL